MVVLTVNYNQPDENGNVNIQMLEGPQGDQGLRGQQGLRGPEGPPGEVRQREYLVAQPSTAYELNKDGRITFGDVLGNLGIAFNTQNGEFTLKAGKAYRVSISLGLNFNMESGQTSAYCSYRLKKADGTDYKNFQATVRKDGSNYNIGQPFALDTIIAPTEDTVLYATPTVIIGATVSVRKIETQLMVQEI